MMARTNWTRAQISDLFDLPFTELIFKAAEVHRANDSPAQVELCTLLSIKTGGCPEDCGYCSQSAHAEMGLKAQKLLDVGTVVDAAREAKACGSEARMR
jgi:biotin synthase